MFDELEKELHRMERDLQRAEDAEEEEGRPGGRGKRVNRCGTFLVDLPRDVQDAIKALGGLDDKVSAIQTEYRKQLSAIRLKYNKLMLPVLQERATLVQEGVGGKARAAFSDTPPGKRDGAVAPIKLRGGPDTWIMAHQPRLAGLVGVPDFWLTAISRSRAVAWRITARDIPVLRYLKDVRCIEFESAPPSQGMPSSGGFRLEFDFAPNRFLLNSTLTKEYWLNEEDPDVLELPEGCDIAWADGCNPGMIGDHTVASFFDFFAHISPPPAEGEASAEQLQRRELQLEDDFDVGLALRHDIVPAALRWYTADVPPERDEDSWEDVEDDDED